MEIAELINIIDGSIKDFNTSIPGVQSTIFDELQNSLQTLKTQNGKILSNVENLKLIGTLRNKLEGIIIDDKYIGNVNSFLKSFEAVTKFHNEYFSSFNKEFTPGKTLPIILENSIEATTNSLLQAGINANVTDKIHDILRQNITTGGSFADLSSQLRDFIVSNPGGGALERYTTQITTDALNQYSAQYNNAIAADLKLEWYMYVGSNMITTRDWCEECTKKKYIHISEFPKLIAGLIDGIQVDLNKKTNLPKGMIPGTNITNLTVNRGGYNCGHQLVAVARAVVPKHIRERVLATLEYKEWARLNNIKPVEIPKSEKQPALTREDKLTSLNSQVITKLKDTFEIEVPTDLFNAIPNVLGFNISKEAAAYYSPDDLKITVGTGYKKRIQKSDYFRETLLPHEMGHAIHYQNDIITFHNVRKDFKTFFEKLQGIMRGHGAESHKLLREKITEYNTEPNKIEQIALLYDVLGSLTAGTYGGGHKVSYYQSLNRAQMEIFAHSVSLLKVPNEFENITPEFKEITEEMREYALNVLKGING